MTAIDIRLPGKATVATLTRSIDQHLGRMRLARVELRYSTQSPVPLQALPAKQAIAKLLREHGLPLAEVSVRAHEGPIDDATGEHLLRLIPAASAAAESPSPAQARGGWRGWLARWLPSLFGRAPAAAPRQEPTAARPVGAVPKALAVAKLREAVQLATGYVETESGTAVTGGTSAEVAQARVTVRLDSLHQVLAPLVQRDVAALAAMVRAGGLKVSPSFTVLYAHKPQVAGDGTGYAKESDIEVNLFTRRDSTQMPKPHASQPAAAAPVATPAQLDDIETALARPDEGTALPPTRRSPALTVRVLGTLHQPFATPIELQFDTLPARFDRHLLAQSAFGQRHAELLPVASNACPLTVTLANDGAPVLQATGRAVPGSSPGAMYHLGHTLEPLVGERRLGTAPLRIIVNAPGGVLHAASGRLLPALVIELQAGPVGHQGATTALQEAV